MENYLILLFCCLILLLLISAFFSGSEIGMMSINRYKLKNKAKLDSKSKRTYELLQKPDSLLSVILIGNTFANICASSVATVIGVIIWGELGAFIATFSLTLIVLIFSEITPKIIASSYPEQSSRFATEPLTLLLKVFKPLVYLLNNVSSKLISILGLSKKRNNEQLSNEELKLVINEDTKSLALTKKDMMVKILELDHLSIDDIMVPKSEIVGIDLNHDTYELEEQIANSQHTILPVYRDNIENLLGIIHIRSILNLISTKKFTKKEISKKVDEAYFTPEKTPLNIQMLNFQKEKKRIGFVVDEYGDILGLITLEDILEEIVGEFTTDMAEEIPTIHKINNEEIIVDGGINLRTLKRKTSIEFNKTSSKTLSGLLTEYLEMIPLAGISVQLNGYILEVLKVEDNVIKSVKITRKITNS